MKKIAAILMSSCLMLAAGHSFADDMMKKDAMSKDAMSKDEILNPCSLSRKSSLTH